MKLIAHINVCRIKTLRMSARNTEVQRMVRQRVSQQAYRQAMLEYWGGTCAVTGLALPQALRASHAKPWAECTSDAERLDVFDGFLLSANLDVLFDSFLVNFSDTGELMVSNAIPPSDQQKMGLAGGMRLRWISVQHGPYLGFHRQRFLQMTTESSQIQQPGEYEKAEKSATLG